MAFPIPSWLDPVAAARSEEASCDELDRLAHNPSPEVRCAVAANPRTHPLTLLRLAEDADDFVLARLVRRPLPTKASCAMGRHERAHVRRWVAEFQYCPPDLREKLARDPDPSVRCATVRKADLCAATLASLANDPCMSVRAMVAMRRDVPVEALLRLATDAHETVRAYALRRFSDNPPPIRWTFPDLEIVAPWIRDLLRVNRRHAFGKVRAKKSKMR